MLIVMADGDALACTCTQAGTPTTRTAQTGVLAVR